MRYSYSYSKKMFIRRAKPIRIIGDRDNQRVDKWSSAVASCVRSLGSHTDRPNYALYH